MERAVLTSFLVHRQWEFCISISRSNIFNIFSFPPSPMCEISADCYAKQFCVSVWLGRQLLGLMRSASTTAFLVIETHAGSRMLEARQWCVVRKCHAVSWKYTLGCSLWQDKWVLLGFGRGWSFFWRIVVANQTPCGTHSLKCHKTASSLLVSFFFFSLMSYNTRHLFELLKI